MEFMPQNHGHNEKSAFQPLSKNSQLSALAEKVVEKRSRATLRERFRMLAQKTAETVGSPWAFLIAVSVIIAWAALGPIYHFSDTWQLVINTGTTIITFLIVFLIQNTQNRDAKAFHLKLDELIRAHRGARNYLLDLEQMTDDELEQLHSEFEKIRERARAKKMRDRR